MAYYLGLSVPMPAKAQFDPAVWEAAVMDLLIETAPLEPLAGDVEQEVHGLLLERQQAMRYDSLINGTPHFFPQQELEQQMDEIRQIAYRQVKLDCVLRDIVQQEALEVRPEELEAEAAAIAQRQKLSLSEVHGFLGDDFSLLRRDLLLRKAIALVCSSATPNISSTVECDGPSSV